MARERFRATTRDKEIAKRFKKLREEKNREGKPCSQRMLSEMIGIVYSRISAIESADCQASIEDLKKYHKYFNVPYEYLLGDSDNRFYTNMENGSTLGLSDKSLFVLKHWNTHDDDGLKYGARDLKALNTLLEGVFDVMDKNPGCVIHSLFGQIWLYLYGEFEHDTATAEPFSQDVLNDPLFQLNKDTLFISEKGKDNYVAYDVNKVMETYVLESITDFIRDLKKGGNK